MYLKLIKYILIQFKQVYPLYVHGLYKPDDLLMYSKHTQINLQSLHTLPKALTKPMGRVKGV